MLLFIITSVFAIQSTNEVKNVDGKEYRVYKVEKGDTWYAIARKFSISYAELRVANKAADDKIEIGEELLIPEKLKSNDPYFQKNYPDNKTKAPASDKFHVVQPSQTLYSISKMYSVSVDQIKDWNNLTSNSISVGQKLIVAKAAPVSGNIQSANNTKPVETEMPQTPPTEVKTEIASPPVVIIEKKSAETEPSLVDTTIVTSGVEDMISPKETEIKPVELPTHVENETPGNTTDDIVFGNGRIQVNETGTATWINEEESYSDKYYALHRTARIGTVIRVMNLENSRKIYVKITGKLPDDAEHDGVLIKLSKASAEKLGITERSARVNLLYGSGDE